MHDYTFPAKGKSKCCKAPMVTVGDEDLGGIGTMHYQCTNCGEPCDEEVKKMKKLKMFYLSRTGYDSKEDCVKQLEKWKSEGTLKDGTFIIEAKKVYKVVEKFELVEV